MDLFDKYDSSMIGLIFNNNGQWNIFFRNISQTGTIH